MHQIFFLRDASLGLIDYVYYYGHITRSVQRIWQIAHIY